MANIHSKILIKYEIDLDQENLLKLYQIDAADISPSELEEKIQKAHKRWNISINGANEKNAQRDRERLEKSEKYEEILKNDKLRRKIYKYYQKKSPSGKAKSYVANEQLSFAREFFQIVETTKKIRKKDVEFYFKYFQSERKNKKAILEMLTKNKKNRNLGQEDYDDESKESDKKNKESRLIVHLFQEDTILQLQRANEKFEEAAQSEVVSQKYPEIRKDFYDFLRVDEIHDSVKFEGQMAERSQDVYTVRQDKGTAFIPLVDMFNILREIGGHKDVKDNIEEFKLLLKYPKLTPYMYLFVEMKPNTLKQLLKVAKRDYVFLDENDFISNYYKILYDNFGISNSKMKPILEKAEKKTKQNKVFCKLEEKIKRSMSSYKMAFIAKILHFLAYWPIFTVYFVFEIAKVLFKEMHKLAIPMGVLVFGLENWILPKIGWRPENVFDLAKIFVKSEWLQLLGRYTYSGEVTNLFDGIFLSILLIVTTLTIYCIPPIAVGYLIHSFAGEFNKQFDWLGIERTFKSIFEMEKWKTEQQFSKQKKVFITDKLVKAFINILCVIGIVSASIYFI